MVVGSYDINIKVNGTSAAHEVRWDYFQSGNTPAGYLGWDSDSEVDSCFYHYVPCVRLSGVNEPI